MSIYKLIQKAEQSIFGRFIFRLWYALIPPITIRRIIYGNKVYFNIRDHFHVLYMSSKSIETAGNDFAALTRLIQTCGKPHPLVWDAGANAGMHSMMCARLGAKVIAFELSPVAARLIAKGALKNNLPVTVVQAAFSVKRQWFAVPMDACPSNKIRQTSQQPIASTCSYKEAAEQFGIPDIIKMDIEGSEYEFLADTEFVEWFNRHNIKMLVEIHGPVPAFQGLKAAEVGHLHYLCLPAGN